MFTFKMSGDDGVVVVRLLNPNRHSGGSTYIYYVIYIFAGYSSIKELKERGSVSAKFEDRLEALECGLSVARGTEYGMSNDSYEIEWRQI